MEWRPIESAPREELPPVLLFGPDGVDIGYYRDWTTEPGWSRFLTAEYDNEMAEITAPTHWMPLPTPPPPDKP